MKHKHQEKEKDTKSSINKGRSPRKELFDGDLKEIKRKRDQHTI